MRARGFSLPETLVAATLLCAGILALSGAHRAMQLLDERGRQESLAAEAAAGHFASRRAAGCSGTLDSASVSVTVAIGGRVRSIRFDQVFACER